MPIPLSQLETWSNIGSTGRSTTAYNSIRAALFKATSPVKVPDEDVYLQGSYANSTNIHGDSDIDVIVLYRNVFHSDLDALSTADRIRHEATFPTSTYHWNHFRDDVLAALRNHFGNGSVIQDKKSIKVKTADGQKPADVVPVVQFRKYATFADRNTLTAHWGVTFFDNVGNQINNYPKYHIERGEAKNGADRTAGMYKKTIRVFKNLRNHMVDRGYIANKKVAPSYFIECALHNVPDQLFVGPLSQTIPAIITHLRTTPFAGFLCQNGVTNLIGDSSTQWRSEDYVTFVMAAQTAWDNYYS